MAEITSPLNTSITVPVDPSATGIPSGVPTAMMQPAMTMSKPFPDVSKIEQFNGDNFKRWQERVFSVLDMHGSGSDLLEY